MSSDFLHSAFDAIIKLVDGITWLIDKVGVLPTALGAFAAFNSFKGKGFFKVIEDDAALTGHRIQSIFGQALSSIKAIFSNSGVSFGVGFEASLADDIAALNNYIAKLQSGVLAEEAFAQTMRQASAAAQEYAQTMNTATMSSSQFETVARQSQITNMAGSFRNAKTLINEYNGGLKNCKLTQTEFIDAVGKGNASFGKYLSGLNGTKASMGGYITSLVGAKVASFALQAATMALNAALTMGISLVVSGIISAVTKWINAEKELAESVEELTSKFKEQSEELQKLKGDYDTSNESSMISKYEKLSKGVDNLGRNVSLTADEYSEYQSIVNKIADQIPSLVSGYDSQGNAILSCKGNVEELTKAYEKLIHTQNQEILTNSGDIEKDVKNTLDKTSGKEWWSNGHGFVQGLLINHGAHDAQLLSRLFDYDLKDDTVEAIQNLINAQSDAEKQEILKQLKQDKFAKEELRDLLPSLGYDIGFFESPYDVLEEALEKDSAKLQEAVNQYYAKNAEVADKYKTIAQAKLSEAFDISNVISGLDYGNITEELQTIAYQVVNSFDSDFVKKLQEQGTTAEQWTTELLNQLNSIGKAKGEYIEDVFELQTQFNGGDIDYGDYISKLKEVESVIDELDLKDEAKNQLKISLGLDDEGVVDQYDALIKRLTTGTENSLGLDSSAVKKFIDDLSVEELSILTKIVPNLEVGTTLDEIQALIDEKLAKEFTFNIDVQTEGIEALNTALAESRSAAGLTSESIAALKARYEDLDGFNAAALFEKTANGIHLNNEELSRLEEQYISTNKLNIDSTLNKLITKYNDLTDEIKNCTDAQEKEALQLEANAYKDKIDEVSTLASQYDGLTSAFSKWQNALNGAEEGDNYDSLYENLESIKELRDKGLVGTDKFKTAAQLMSNKDLSNADIDEIVAAFDKGYPKMQRYFTEGQKGCKNFLNDVSNLNSEWAHMNEDGSWEISFNSEEVAKELGISVDFVLQIAKKLKDYGFEVNLEDTSVKNLQTEIEKTEAKLKELGQTPHNIEYNIEANSANLGKIETEIDKVKSTIQEVNNSSLEPNAKTAQLDDLRAKLEVLIDKKIEASQPAYMTLNTSQVSASLVDALEKVQAYQNAVDEVNKLNELKEAGITIDDTQLKQAKEKVDECAKAIQGLDGDVKVAIGLEEDGSIDSIKKAFEEGKVKIDADTDPAINKIEQLAENVEKIEDKDVTINVTVNGLDDVKELNKQIDLATDIKGDVDKLSDYVKNAKELKDLGENITSYVTAEVKGDVIDTFEYKLDNLKVFTDSAKDIEQIGHVQSEVSANIKGNVVDEFEYKIDNLKVYSDSAKNVSDIGNVESTVKADIKGNVTDEFEYKINNLKVFSESAKDIDKIGNVESNVKATINSGEDGDVIDEFEYKLDNLKKFAEYAKELQGISDVDISVKATVNTGGNDDVVEEFEYKLDNLSEFANHVKELQGLKSIDISINAVVNTGEDGDVVDEFEYKLNNLDKFADYVKELQGLTSVDVSVNATINNGDNAAIDEFEYKLNNLKTFAEGAKALQGIGNISSEITAKVNTGESGDAVDTFEYKLNNLKTFAEGAKALQGVGNVSSTITAKINSGSDGDVVDEFEYKLNNLEKFAQYAKDLQGIGSVDVSVSAKVNTSDGEGEDVTDTFEYKLNNLDDFASYAKELQGLTDVDITIKANIKTGEDSATNEWEYRLNNLGDFASYAKELQGLASVDITITANAKGNVVGKKTEGKINNLEVFAKGAKGLVGIESKDITITANAKGNVVGKKTESKINNLEVFAVGAKKVQGLSSKDITITANAKGNVVGKKTEGKINNLKVFGDSAKALNGVESKTVSITADANGNVVSGEGASSRLSSLAEFKSLISGMSNQTVTVSVTANVEAEKVNQAITLLQSVANSGVFKDYKATVQVGAKIATIDDTTVKNYNAPKKDGKVTYSVDPNSSVFTWTAPDKDGVVNYSASVEALTDSQKYKSGTITYKAKVEGVGGINGTANANGSAGGRAFAHGNWRTKKTETALTGELGREIVVTPENRWYTVGDRGAEFTTIPKGSIVFNHKQTEELLANGKVTSGGGRGTALANGTALVRGSGSFYAAYDDGEKIVVEKKNTNKLSSSIPYSIKQIPGYTKPTSGLSTSNASKQPSDTNATGTFIEEKIDKTADKVEDKFEETFDWVEIAISRLERTIDNFDQTVNNVYKSWSDRNTALANEISAVGEEITLQNNAANKYLAQANAVGLSESWAKKVRDGSIDISTITDEDLADKIGEYQKWYELALDAQDAIQELKEKEAELYEQRFEHVQSQYDGILQGFEHTEAMLNEYISQAEEKGYILSKNYYQALIDNEKSRIAKLKDEQSALITKRDEAVASGTIEKYSESWYDMCADIDSVTQAIEEGTTSLISYANAMRDIDWQTFDLIQERISAINDEADFLIELMSNDKLFDDKGNMTNEGLATMGLHGQKYNTYMYQADDYAKEIANIDTQIASGELDGNSQDVINRRQELLELQRESILAAEDEKIAMQDLISDGYDKQLESLQEIIDAKNEALESEKDLFEYQKRVKEQTSEIADIRKRLSAYENDSSEEARAKVQELKVSLKEAETNLEETEYDKYLSDTQQMLDTLYDEYELTLNARLDNLDYLVQGVIDAVNIAAGVDGTLTTALGAEGAIATALGTSATTIKTTLENEVKNVGATLSTAMSNIWNNEGSGNKVITMYGEGFQQQQTTTNTVLDSIKANVARMVDDVDKDAKVQIQQPKTQPATKADPTKNNVGNKGNNNGSKQTITDDTLKGIAASIWIHGKDSGWGNNPFRENKLTNKLGAANAKKIQDIVNRQGASGVLYNYWIDKNFSLKKYFYNAFATGAKRIDETQYAWTQENGKEFIVRPSDGAILTPIAKGDSVLTSAASSNIWDMANSPAEFIKDNLNLGVANTPNGSSVNNSCIQNFENITFNMPNVRNYEQLLSEMQKDKSFEKLILSMTVDQIAGKSSLTKNKSIR